MTTQDVLVINRLASNGAAVGKPTGEASLSQASGAQTTYSGGVAGAIDNPDPSDPSKMVRYYDEPDEGTNILLKGWKSKEIDRTKNEEFSGYALFNQVSNRQNLADETIQGWIGTSADLNGVPVGTVGFTLK